MRTQLPATTPSFDSLFTIPTTPTITPASLHSLPSAAQRPTLSVRPSPAPVATPASPVSSSSPHNAAKRVARTAPTGTRRNVTPSTLLPPEAPTQTRNYLTPSTTSRKMIPAAFQARAVNHKRERDEEEEEEDFSDSLLGAIEAKRRQNTVAARKSRQRKVEHLRNLEESVDRLRSELDEAIANGEQWKARALAAEEQLRG